VLFLYVYMQDFRFSQQLAVLTNDVFWNVSGSGCFEGSYCLHL